MQPWKSRLNRSPRWLIPLGALLALAGYFGPWINHDVAGLVITGLDLAEYVKFLPEMLAGRLSVWREGYYLPLVAVSLALSLHAFDPRLNYNWLGRGLLLTVALIAALNLLPPAWTPQRMLTPEFRLQALALATLVGGVAVSPFLALVPAWIRGSLVSSASLAAIWFPVRDFTRILDDISFLYNHPQTPAWGMTVMIIGLSILTAAGLMLTGVDNARRTSE